MLRNLTLLLTLLLAFGVTGSRAAEKNGPQNGPRPAPRSKSMKLDFDDTVVGTLDRGKAETIGVIGRKREIKSSILFRKKTEFRKEMARDVGDLGDRL